MLSGVANTGKSDGERKEGTGLANQEITGKFTAKLYTKNGKNVLPQEESLFSLY